MTLIKILVVHPGTQHSSKLAKQFYRKNMLLKLVTGIAIEENGFLHRVIHKIPASIRNTFNNRIVSGLPQRMIRMHPITEFRFVKKARLASNKEEVWFERNKNFQQAIPMTLIQKSDVVIGFDTSSWILGKRVTRAGKKFVLDVSIAHSQAKNKVYATIASHFPKWGFAVEQKSQELLAIEQEEYHLADAIVVASQFTRKTLMDNGVAEDKIFINPYGIDTSYFKCKEIFYSGGPVKFLFVGLVDARKGIPLLLEAVKNLPADKASFTLVGPVNSQIENLIESYNLPNVQLAGKIQHKDLTEVFSKHDVFIFPSFFEGFGLVILEAMASGLPVITTEATGGPDCMEDGLQGFIVESGNANNLEKKILHFVGHPEQIKVMGLAARKKAETFSWDAYGDRWEKIVNQICKNSN